MGVINPDEHCFLYSPCDVLGLPTHCGKAAQFDGMTYGVGMVINEGGGPKMFLVSIPKGPTSFPNVLPSGPKMVTLVSVDNTSFVGDVILVPGGY